MTKAALNKAVEQRTQQRLAARKEAAKQGAETRRSKEGAPLADVATKKAALKKHEAKLVADTRKMLDAEAAAEAKAQAEQPKPAPTTPRAAKTQKAQPQSAERQTKRAERNVAQDRPAADATLRSSDASSLRSTSRGAMATVALRGEQAERLRGLAAKHETTLAKLLVRMMEVFEAQAG